MFSNFHTIKLKLFALAQNLNETVNFSWTVELDTFY